MGAKANTRAEAARVLASLLQGQGSLSSLLPAASEQVKSADRGLLQELCFGSCRYYPRLDGQVSALLSKPLKHKDADILGLLYIGCYQLAYMRVPDHAAIGETVEATKALGKPWAKGLVNGVLRQFQRQGETLIDQLSDAENQAHPAWLYGKLRKQWPEQYHDIVTANNHQPPMALRVNAGRGSRGDYCQRLADAGIEATECRYSPWGLQLTSPRDVADLPGFSDGLCSVQDEASQLVAALVLADAPERVLDACSAPGGKTCHLLEQGGDALVVDAVEIDARRLQRVTENLQRLQLSAGLIVADASAPEQWWDQRPYDAILLDAPCSATGVIRRHPDIKVLRHPDDLDKLNALQGQLLDALWPCLKPGGRLVYTTCSVLREENDRVLERFIGQTPNARVIEIDSQWGIQQKLGKQLLPTTNEHDGFYYACLYKAA